MAPVTNIEHDFEETGEYIPGVCNIGRQEVMRRRNATIFAGILSAAIIAILLFTHSEKLWRFLAFAPLFSFGIGVEQWYFKFCAGFGLKGVFNFKDLGETKSIELEEMRKLDRAKAIRILVTAFVFALILTAALYLVP